LLRKDGLEAFFAQQKPRDVQSLNRAELSQLVSAANDPHSGRGLGGEHGSGRTEQGASGGQRAGRELWRGGFIPSASVRLRERWR
jgi:hypothetical protein